MASPSWGFFFFSLPIRGHIYIHAHAACFLVMNFLPLLYVAPQRTHYQAWNLLCFLSFLVRQVLARFCPFPHLHLHRYPFCLLSVLLFAMKKLKTCHCSQFGNSVPGGPGLDEHRRIPSSGGGIGPIGYSWRLLAFEIPLERGFLVSV
jgi:hypothetical protein